MSCETWTATWGTNARQMRERAESRDFEGVVPTLLVREAAAKRELSEELDELVRIVEERRSTCRVLGVPGREAVGESAAVVMVRRRGGAGTPGRGGGAGGANWEGSGGGVDADGSLGKAWEAWECGAG